MKNFLIIFFILVNFQSFTKADDINNFEIEGISVGKSAFDFFTKNEIDEFKSYVYKSKKYAMFGKDLTNSNYDTLQIEFIDNGNYIINSVIGKIFYRNKKDFNQCAKKEKEVLIELKDQFGEISKYIDHGIVPHEADPSGKSKGSWHTFELDDGSGWIYLECMDWTEETGKWDNLRVTIFNEVFAKFLRSDAY